MLLLTAFLKHCYLDLLRQYLKNECKPQSLSWRQLLWSPRISLRSMCAFGTDTYPLHYNKKQYLYIHVIWFENPWRLDGMELLVPRTQLLLRDLGEHNSLSTSPCSGTVLEASTRQAFEHFKVIHTFGGVLARSYHFHDTRHIFNDLLFRTLEDVLPPMSLVTPPKLSSCQTSPRTWRPKILAP